MKKLIKAAVALACVALLSYPTGAENYLIPQDNNGNLPGDINLLGSDVFVATAATAMGSTRPVMVYGYSVSSDVPTNFAMLRDSATPNTTSNIKLALWPDATCAEKALNLTTATQMTCHSKLPVPVLFRNGLSINLANAVPGGGMTGAQGRSRWMFYIRYLDVGGVTGKKPSDVDPAITVDNKGVN